MENGDAEPKKQVSQEVLDRLKKGRELANQRRKELAEKKRMAKEIVAGGTDSLAEEPIAPAAEVHVAPSPPPEMPREQPKKASKIEAIESDSSTDSSDSSDSEIDEPRKRSMGKPAMKLSDKFKLELEKAKAKYRARYERRYEILAKSREIHVPKVEPAPQHETSQRETTRETSSANNMRRAVADTARVYIADQVNKELIQTALKNMFG